MPRLFTALEIPEDIADGLALLRGGLIGARWIEPEDYHITLRFIGDVDARAADDVAETLRDIRRPPLAIAFEALAWFGGDKPRAIVAKVRATPELAELQAEHERRMRRIGLPAETRNFLPHVTLARIKSASPATVADYLGARGQLRIEEFKAAQFVLYSARDSVGGGPYAVEARYPLR
jgi:2'-5' RNA ligase